MPDICLVVPCYNEEARLRGSDILDFLRVRPRVTICFVDDGSADGTGTMLARLREDAPAGVLVHTLPVNGGKAEAVRQGVLHAIATGTYRFIGYWDADLSAPLSELDRLLAALEADPGLRLAMGCRVKRLGATIDRRPWRHVIGRIFATAASWMLRLPVYDSQCGAKLLRAEATGAFHERFISTWLFDLEILARLRNELGIPQVMRTVAEVPLGSWIEVGGSRLGPRDFLRAPIELLRIHVHYNDGLLSRVPRTAS